jgi:hypothetical protein
MPEATAQKKFPCPACGAEAQTDWQRNVWQGNKGKALVFPIPLPNIPLPIPGFLI